MAGASRYLQLMEIAVIVFGLIGAVALLRGAASVGIAFLGVGDYPDWLEQELRYMNQDGRMYRLLTRHR
jgi:hypothetical protein